MSALDSGIQRWTLLMPPDEQRYGRPRLGRLVRVPLSLVPTVDLSVRLEIVSSDDVSKAGIRCTGIGEGHQPTYFRMEK